MGDALGALSRQVGRQFRARRLRARARRHVVAACGGAHQGTSGRVRLRAGKAVRLSQGVSDAGRAQASRQEAPAGPGRSGVEDSGQGRRGDGDCAVDSTSRACSTTATHCGRLRWIGRSSRRRAAAFVRRRFRRSCTASSSAATPTIARAPCVSTVSAGVGVEQVFRRKSGVSLSEPMPSLYGTAVFQEVTGQGRAELVKQLAEDDWVWGEGGVSGRKSGEDRGRRHQSLRAGLHPRLGRALERPRVRVVLDRAADERGAPDPHRTDVAAARPAEGRRRQHGSRRACPRRSVSPVRSRRPRRN